MGTVTEPKEEQGRMGPEPKAVTNLPSAYEMLGVKCGFLLALY